MSVAYRAVGWTPAKKVYDLVIALFVVTYLGLFVAVTLLLRPQATFETVAIRATATCALLLLHVVLAIGPLSRLDRRFLPLLYNRRHLGVATFLVAAAHGSLSLVQFHGFGDVNPLVSVLTSNGRWASLSQFPFQVLGLIALTVLFLMAATSHDFWLANLSAPVWKSLHMLVYPAYGLVVLHVATGALQSERSPVLAAVLGAGVMAVFGLHVVVGWKERAGDRPGSAARDDEGFEPLCSPQEIEEGRARIFSVAGERIAVFRWDGKLAALSNVCQHQNGPLGEGRIVDGCVTCPWHGYQYLPETGASPPPFTERIPTFRLKLVNDRVWVDPRPAAPGTRIEPLEWTG